MYLTYNEYREYGGTLDETAFADINFEAESYVDWYTFNRLWGEEVISTRVKKCVYHIMKLIEAQETLLNAPISNSQSSATSASSISRMDNDGVSITYDIISAKDALDMSKDKVDKLIKHYLQGVTNSLGRKLLYRGMYPDE